MARALIVLVLLALLPGASVRAEDAPGFALRWGGLGTANGRFQVPDALDCDLFGNVYVAEFNGNRIQKFTNNGAFLAKWGSPGKNPGQFNSPSGIGVDKVGDVYVVDSYNNRVQKFTSDGVFLSSWGGVGSGDGQFSFPVAIAFSGAGDVYVTDVSQCRVQRFSREGVFLSAWGAEGNGDGEFLSPTGIVTDGADNVYVVDSGNDRVQVFDRLGNFLRSWGSPGRGPGQFDYPLGIAIDSEGDLYVADTNANRVSKFRGDGTFLVSWGSHGVGDGYFDGAFDVAVDKDDNVFVADAYHHFVQKFDPRIPPPPPRPDYRAKIVLHLTTPVSKNICANGLPARCEDAVVTGRVAEPNVGPYYFAYLMVARGDISSVAGLQFGLSYEHNGPNDLSDGKGVDIFAWTLCADREFQSPPGSPPGAPAFPGPGSGNIVTWNYLNNCQFGDQDVAGYFYVAAYTPDVMRITARPLDNIAAVADCVPVGYNMTEADLGFVTFSASGNVPGCNPCVMNCAAPTRTVSTTWSAIKALFH